MSHLLERIVNTEAVKGLPHRRAGLIAGLSLGAWILATSASCAPASNVARAEEPQNEVGIEATVTPEPEAYIQEPTYTPTPEPTATPAAPPDPFGIRAALTSNLVITDYGKLTILANTVYQELRGTDYSYESMPIEVKQSKDFEAVLKSRGYRNLDVNGYFYYSFTDPKERFVLLRSGRYPIVVATLLNEMGKADNMLRTSIRNTDEAVFETAALLFEKAGAAVLEPYGLDSYRRMNTPDERRTIRRKIEDAANHVQSIERGVFDFDTALLASWGIVYELGFGSELMERGLLTPQQYLHAYETALRKDRAHIEELAMKVATNPELREAMIESLYARLVPTRPLSGIRTGIGSFAP